MRRIAIFGGSFDPIHKGHIEIAKIALSEKTLDEVIFMPSGLSPHKESLAASSTHRYNMAVLAVAEEEGFSVSDFEIKKNTKCYSFETVSEFRERYPDDELYFIIGDDQYKSFFSWYRSDELLEMCTFLVFTRGGGEIKQPFSEIKIPPIEISSSEIREKIKNGQNIRDMVSPEVFRYIEENKLYR